MRQKQKQRPLRGQSKSRGRSKSRYSKKCYHCSKEGHIKRNCRLLKKESNGENNQKKENDKNATTTVFESEEIGVLSFEGNECNYGRDDFAEWVIDSAASYHATPHMVCFLPPTKLVTLGQ